MELEPGVLQLTAKSVCDYRSRPGVLRAERREQPMANGIQSTWLRPKPHREVCQWISGRVTTKHKLSWARIAQRG